MPVGKRKRISDTDLQSKAKRSNRHTATAEKKLYELDKIGYKSDHWHSIYRSLPDGSFEVKRIIYKEAGSFLNGAGGILCFGCRSNGCIYGMNITRKEEDNIRLIIDDAFKKFHPFILPSIYRVNFREIHCSAGRSRSSSRKAIIEIKISANDGMKMYEDEFHEVFIRSKESYKGPLTPHEIKKFVTDMYNKQSSKPSSVEPKKASLPVKTINRPTATIHPLEVCHKASGSGSSDTPKESSDTPKEQPKPTNSGEGDGEGTLATNSKKGGASTDKPPPGVCTRSSTRAAAAAENEDKNKKVVIESKQANGGSKIKGLVKKVVSIVRPKSATGKTGTKPMSETGTSSGSIGTTSKSTTSVATTNTTISKSCSDSDVTIIKVVPPQPKDKKTIPKSHSLNTSTNKPHPYNTATSKPHPLKPITNTTGLMPPSYYSSKPPPQPHPPPHWPYPPPVRLLNPPTSYYYSSTTGNNSLSWAPPPQYTNPPPVPVAPYSYQPAVTPQYHYQSSNYPPHRASYAPPPPGHSSARSSSYLIHPSYYSTARHT